MPSPTWRGEPLTGKTLLVWGEQGMGDVLQFSRYIPLLAERVHREGGRLVWVAPLEFHGFVQLLSRRTSPGVIVVSAEQPDANAGLRLRAPMIRS